MANKGLNGDAKVIVERIDNLKEYIKEKFDHNRQEHQNIFKILTKHGRSISYLTAYMYLVSIAIGFLYCVYFLN